jgi:membrane protease YdiL (CAAX protease family)
VHHGSVTGDAGGPAQGASDGSSPPTVPHAAPGWHADPSGRFRRRWWDGSGWTAYAGGDAPDDIRWDPAPVEAPLERGARRGGIGIGVASFAIGAVLSIVVSHLLPEHAGLTSRLLAPSAALWVGLLGGCVVVHRRDADGSFAEDFRLRFRWIDVAFGLVGSIAGRLMTAAAASPIPLPSTRLRDLDRAPAQLTTASTWVALFAVICIGAPLVEELLFRGLLQPRLVARFGPVVGVGLASALFGAAHLLGWNGPLTFGTAWAIGVGGLALGTLRHYSGRLGPSILAHAFFNGQVFLLLYLTR